MRLDTWTRTLRLTVFHFGADLLRKCIPTRLCSVDLRSWPLAATFLMDQCDVFFYAVTSQYYDIEDELDNSGG